MKTDSVDSGWAWLVLLAASIILFIMEGLTKALSVLLPTLEDQFEIQVWVLGVMITCMKSARDFSGIGFALLVVPMYSLLGKHFYKYHPLACGILYACGSLGLMVYAPLSQFLLTLYGWRNTLLLIAALSFHLIVSGALYPSSGNVDKQPALQTTPDMESLDLQLSHDNYQAFGWMSHDMQYFKSNWNKFLEISGASLLTNRSVLAVCAMMASISITYGGWIVYFIPHCLVKGLSLQEASFLASAAAFSNLVGHVAYIPFTSRNLLSVRACLHISGTIAAIGLIADVYAVTITTIAVSNIIFTFGIGIAYALCDVLLKSVVESSMLAKAFGWRMAISGMARIFAGFIVGWIYDQTGSYNGGFLFLAMAQFLGVMALLADNILQ